MSAVKQRCRSYDYTGQHKRRTISLPLELKYCIDCKAIISETQHSGDRFTANRRCHSIIKGCVHQSEFSTVSSCCSLQAAASEWRLRLSVFSGCPVQSSSASPTVKVIATSPPPTSSLTQLPHTIPVIVLEQYHSVANKQSTHRWG